MRSRTTFRWWKSQPSAVKCGAIGTRRYSPLQKTREGDFISRGHGGFGSALQVGDGNTIWRYRPDEHTYTEVAVASYDPNTAFYIGPETQIATARLLRRTLAEFSTHYKSATRLPDENVDVSSHTIPCYVVHLQASDRKRSTDETYEETIWIDKAKELFVKRKSRGRIFMFPGTGRIPQDQETTMLYLVTEFGAPLPGSRFTFAPPADAKLVDAFPSPRENAGGQPLKGQMIPELKLTPASGRAFSTTSFRGKVLVLDIWATWCAPCVKGLEELASIYKDAKDKGLVLLTIDQDEDPEKATAMLAKKG